MIASFVCIVRESPTADQAKFMEHTYNIFLRGLERELYRQEAELTVCVSTWVILSKNSTRLLW